MSSSNPKPCILIHIVILILKSSYHPFIIIT